MTSTAQPLSFQPTDTPIKPQPVWPLAKPGLHQPVFLGSMGKADLYYSSLPQTEHDSLLCAVHGPSRHELQVMRTENLLSLPQSASLVEAFFLSWHRDLINQPEACVALPEEPSLRHTNKGGWSQLMLLAQLIQAQDPYKRTWLARPSDAHNGHIWAFSNPSPGQYAISGLASPLSGSLPSPCRVFELRGYSPHAGSINWVDDLAQPLELAQHDITVRA